MITDNGKWNYFAVKSLSTLFKRITSKHNGDFYCLNCLHSFTAENKLKNHKNVFENHEYCYIDMSEKNDKVMKYNHGKKSKKASFIIDAKSESLLEIMRQCNPEN